MEVSRWLHEMPKPTIAMVRGAAAGAGLSLAMACDMRLAGDSARASGPRSPASAIPATSGGPSS
jgi:enoyl-CoA hydratase/carnithine racemase